MLIEEFHPKNAQDIQEALKDLLGDTMEKLLKAELDKIQLKDKFQKELDD